MLTSLTKYKKLGFRKVPDFPFMVHPVLDVVVQYTETPEGMRFTYPNIMKGEYKSVSLNGVGQHLHRLKGMAFLKPPKGYTFNDLVINHKDGCKLNNHIDNLEWVTYSENNKHAYVNGLRKDNKACVVRDILNNRIHHCYSRAEAARIIGLHSYQTANYLNDGRKDLIHFRFELAEDESQLLYIDKKDIWKHVKYCPIKVLDTLTKEEAKLHKKEVLYRHLKVQYDKIPKLTLVAGEKYLVLNRYEVSLITDYDEIVTAVADCRFKFKKPEHRKPIKSKARQVQVIKPDGTVMLYQNLHEAAIALDVGFNALQKRMSKKYNGEWKGHKLTYRCSSKTSLIAGITR